MIVPPGPVLAWTALGIQSGGNDVYQAVDVEYEQGGLHYKYSDHCCSRPRDRLVSAAVQTSVLLDGSQSEGTRTACRFEARKSNQLIWSTDTSPTCTATTDLPADTDTEVTLTVFYENGKANTTTIVHPHDYLIVGLGDSYGSGEGSFAYADQRCDRSILSAQAQVALDLERSDPHTSVTFIHLACSGAKIEDPTSPRKGGLVDRYSGVHSDRPSVNEGCAPLPGQPCETLLLPQVEAARRLLDQDGDQKIDRPIDALLISIGGNDANFAHVVLKCGAPGPLQQLSYLGEGDILNALAAELWLFPCYSNLVPGSAYYSFEDGKKQLPGRFNRLRAELAAKLSLGDAKVLPPDRVYLWEYPVATRNEQRDYCNGTDLRFWDSSAPAPGGGQGILSAFTWDEFKWAETTVGPALNGAIKATAQTFGWTFIEGITDAFQTHGICAVDSWLVRPADSIFKQGDTNGTFHPTAKGYRVMADHIGSKVTSDIKARLSP